MDTEPLLEARNLVKDFGSTRIIDGVSLHLMRGETLGLVGESGSGKSTIGRLLLRLIEPTSGDIIFRSCEGSNEDSGDTSTRTFDLMRVAPREMRRLRRKLSIVFQDPYAALNPRMSVRQILSEPFVIHNEQPGASSSPAALSSGRVGSHDALDARLHELLAEVGLEPSALQRYPHEFSGGQRQRINIARALALRPELLVLDEPVSALDVSVGAQVINLLRDLQQRYGLTYLFISHSMPLVRYLCHRVAVMQRGRIVETGTWSEVCDHPREAYTQHLLAATPELPVSKE